MAPRLRVNRRLAAALLAIMVAGCTGESASPRSTVSSASSADAGEVDAAPTVPGDAPWSTPAVPEDVDLVGPAPLHPSVDGWPAGTVVVDPGDGADVLPVGVRIAATDDRRRHGLMEVLEVPDGTGMWFSYDEDRIGAFWMKGTETDLDIAWVDGAGRIVAVATMQVCTADPCERYEPGATYRSALEVPAGWLAAHDVEVGDTAVLVATDP